MKKGLPKKMMTVIAVAISAILLLPFFACGNDIISDAGNETVTATESSIVADETESSQTAAIAEPEEIKLTDGLGKEIVLSGPSDKIIVFTPSALEIIDGLGGMDSVIGVDSWSVESKEPLAEGFEGFGDSYALNMEKITAAAPDIIIGLAGWTEAETQKLTDLGIEIYIVEANAIDEVYIEIENIGKILGKDTEARSMIDELKKQVEEITSKIAGLTDDKKPAVFYEVWNEPLMSAGKNTSINDLIEKSGGKNIAGEEGLEGWPEYSVEKLIQNNPDIIIAPVSLAPSASVIMDDGRFSGIKAVIEGKVYVVPDNPVNRPSQNIIKALTMFAQAIHPEIFGEFSF